MAESNTSSRIQSRPWATGGENVQSQLVQPEITSDPQANTAQHLQIIAHGNEETPVLELADVGEVIARDVLAPVEQVNERSHGQSVIRPSTNDSVILLISDDDDDEIVCLTPPPLLPPVICCRPRAVVTERATSHPLLPMIPPFVPSSRKLPPESVARVRKCPVCLDTLDAVRSIGV